MGGGRKLWAKRAIRAAIAVVVLVALGRHVGKTVADLRASGRGLTLDLRWAAVGVAFYLMGLTCFGYIYARALAAGGTPIGGFAALRAYFVSQLGKYVPGKAMVVVLRAGLSAPHGARPATAALATFYETLTMMASGGFVAAAGFALTPDSSRRWPMVVAAGLGCGFLLLVEPRVFPRLAALARPAFPSVGPDAFPPPSHRFLLNALLMGAIAWLFLGLSQLAVARSVGVLAPREAWPLIVAGVALATVVGFVAGLPGGLFVREWVLMMSLAPALGMDRAVVASLALRLAWVATEVAAAASLGVWRPTRPSAGPDPS